MPEKKLADSSVREVTHRTEADLRNESTIGPEAAADLAADFDEWDKAFHLAAGHGLVQFS